MSEPSASTAPAQRLTSRRDEFEARLESVAHDLRSPLLTMALSAELLQDAGAAAREQVAYGALREGIRDLERMLDAVTTLSRAARRTLVTRSALAGVVPRELLPQDIGIDADARLVAELIDALGPDAEFALRLEEGVVELSGSLSAPPDLAARSPLAALLDSLKAHAGGIVERLAAIELQAARQGGTLTVVDGSRRAAAAAHRQRRLEGLHRAAPVDPDELAVERLDAGGDLAHLLLRGAGHVLLVGVDEQSEVHGSAPLGAAGTARLLRLSTMTKRARESDRRLRDGGGVGYAQDLERARSSAA